MFVSDEKGRGALAQLDQKRYARNKKEDAKNILLQIKQKT
jgi:hypothetical protein